MQYNSQQMNRQLVKTDEVQEIEQYFGTGNLFEQQEVSGGQKTLTPIRPSKKKDWLAWLSVVEKIPMKMRQGYSVFFVLLGISALWLLFHVELGSFFLCAILGAVSYLIWKKADFTLTQEFLHYLTNAQVTLRALLKQISLTKFLLPYSQHILVASILVLIAEQMILWFLPNFITDMMYGMAFFSMFVGIMLVFANKDYEILYSSLYLYAISCLLEVIFDVFRYNYLYFFVGVSFLFFWTIACYVKAWIKQEEDIHLNQSEKV